MMSRRTHSRDPKRHRSRNSRPMPTPREPAIEGRASRPSRNRGIRAAGHCARKARYDRAGWRHRRTRSPGICRRGIRRRGARRRGNLQTRHPQRKRPTRQISHKPNRRRKKEKPGGKVDPFLGRRDRSGIRPSARTQHGQGSQKALDSPHCARLPRLRCRDSRSHRPYTGHAERNSGAGGSTGGRSQHRHGLHGERAAGVIAG